MKCNEYDVDNKDALGLGIDFINRGRNFNVEINMLNSSLKQWTVTVQNKH